MLDAGCWEEAPPQHPASSIQHLFSEEVETLHAIDLLRVPTSPGISRV
jgi:hypothetical protein